MPVFFAAINVWTIESNKNKAKTRRNSQQIAQEREANVGVTDATNQKFVANGKILSKKSGLGHEGKYTPK